MTKRIKGDAKGRVIVNQVAGTDPSTGQFVAFEGDVLLHPGDKVLLITEFGAGVGWYHLITAGFSHHRIANDEQEQKLVERFARAVRVPIP